jgi:hypothetical protein
MAHFETFLLENICRRRSHNPVGLPLMEFLNEEFFEMSSG